MIVWDTADPTPPSLLTAIDNEILQHRRVDFISGIPCHILKQLSVWLKWLKYLCSSSKVYGHESRHGMILQ